MVYETIFDGKIFDVPSEELDGDSTGGFLVGGIAARTNPIALAREFRTAGDRLIELYMNDSMSYEVASPILYLYRQSLELYLKAIVGDCGKKHDLRKLIQKLDEWMVTRYGRRLTSWVKDRLLEFHHLDPKSTALRYADEADTLLGGEEHWVDLHRLQSIFLMLTNGIERLASKTST